MKILKQVIIMVLLIVGKSSVGVGWFDWFGKDDAYWAQFMKDFDSDVPAIRVAIEGLRQIEAINEQLEGLAAEKQELIERQSYLARVGRYTGVISDLPAMVSLKGKEAILNTERKIIYDNVVKHNTFLSGANKTIELNNTALKYRIYQMAHKTIVPKKSTTKTIEGPLIPRSGIKNRLELANDTLRDAKTRNTAAQRQADFLASQSNEINGRPGASAEAKQNATRAAKAAADAVPDTQKALEEAEAEYTRIRAENLR